MGSTGETGAAGDGTGATAASAGRLMRREMAEQPATVAALIERRDDIRSRLAPLFKGIAGTVVVARGSSDHAATYGRYLLEMATGRPVASASPSVHLLYGAEMDFHDYAVVAVSQSGRTPEITATLRWAAENGARTVALTNDEESPLAEAADEVVALGAGAEQAVPATKTVTAALVAFALIADALGGLEIPGRAWDELPGQLEAVLEDHEPAAELAAWLAPASRLVTIARGLLLGAAAETALKIEETSGTLATAYSAADLRHGPIAIAGSGVPVLALAHPGPAAADVTGLATELAERGASVRLIGPVAGTRATWSATAPEILAPVLAVVRGQQVALELALALGRDPDSPRGLTKITLT